MEIDFKMNRLFDECLGKALVTMSLRPRLPSDIFSAPDVLLMLTSRSLQLAPFLFAKYAYSLVPLCRIQFVLKLAHQWLNENSS